MDDDYLQTESLPQLDDVQRIIDNTHKIKRLVETLQHNLKTTALSMVDHLNEDGKTDLKPQMDQIDKAFLTTIALTDQLNKYSNGAINLRTYVEGENRNIRNNTQSQESRNQVGSGENLADKYLSDYKNPLNIDRYVNHKDFKQLKREIAELDGNQNGDQELGEDEDLAVASQSISTNCPITQTLIVDPYKSLVCNHIFNKDGIFGMFGHTRGNNIQIKCPVAGCNSKFTKNQIQSYPEFNLIIKRELRKRERERASQVQEDITEV